jgi:hypothetical protein
MNREMSFFGLCPFQQMGLHGPKNGMKLNQELLISGGSASSRFSGQMSEHNRGIAKKDSSLPIGLSQVHIGGFRQSLGIVSRI